MSMVKVRMNVDEGWWFWPEDEFPSDAELQELLDSLGEDRDNPTFGGETLGEFVVRTSRPSIEIPQELFDEYKAAYERFCLVHSQMEQLYRVQQGMAPFESPPIPEYRKL